MSNEFDIDVPNNPTPSPSKTKTIDQTLQQPEPESNAVDLPDIDIDLQPEVPAYVVEPDAKKLAVKFGIIGSGQGGCIAGSTNVYVSGLGIITIRELFEEKLRRANMTDIKVTEGKDTCVLLKDVYTIGVDPETGKLHRAKVNAVWKNQAKVHKKIIFENNSELFCSKTHPTFVFRPNSKPKIFARSINDTTPLQIGDNVLDGRGQVLDVSDGEDQVFRGVAINQDIGWLLGLFAGDGSAKRAENGNEVAFYLDDESVVIKAKRILESLHFDGSISISDRPGCKLLRISGLQASLFFKAVFNYDGGYKANSIRIPHCVSASSPMTRLGFLAGVVDSDAEVASRWCEIELTTVSEKFADELSCLGSTLGMRAVCSRKQPGEKGNLDTFHVSFSGKYNFGPLLDIFVTLVSHKLRGGRLTDYASRDQKSFATSSTSLTYNELKTWLTQAGFVNGNQAVVNHGLSDPKAWIRGDRRLSLPKFHELLDTFKSEKLEYVRQISPSLCSIKGMEDTNIEESFYDLSVEKIENYFAGNKGLVLTHNSRLADTFWQIGYRRVCVINTTAQDFLGLSVPKEKQMVLRSTDAGAGKNPNKGRQSLTASTEEVLNLMRHSFGEDIDRIIVTIGAGGGTGTGSAVGLYKLAKYYLQNLGKEPKVGMVVTLPKKTEGGKVQGNAYRLMEDLKILADVKALSPFIVVDNEAIHQMFPNVSAKKFWTTANRNTVGLFDIFNVLACQQSEYVTFDAADYQTVLDSGVLVFGATKLDTYQKDTDISDGLRTNLKRTLLADADITEATHVAAILCAPDKLLDILPQAHIDLAFATLERIMGGENRDLMVHQGVYEAKKMGLYLYTIVGGLSISEQRLNLMKMKAGLFEDVEEEDKKSDGDD